MSVQNLIDEAFFTAQDKGWHDEPREFGTVIALIHSEVTEAYEATLAGGQDNLGEELADVLIRIYDACGEFGIPMSNYTTKTRLEIPLLPLTIQRAFLELHKHISHALEDYRASKETDMWHRVALRFVKVYALIYSMDKQHTLEIDRCVREKMEKNKQRPHRHGGKRA